MWQDRALNGQSCTTPNGRRRVRVVHYAIFY
jgi:hypothetical protein